MTVPSSPPEVPGLAVGSTPPCVNIDVELVQLRSFGDIRRTLVALGGERRRSDVCSGVATPPSGVLRHGRVNTLREPNVLCIWDVDDTLVTSGRDGGRQQTLFDSDGLLHLFNSFPARHLLLTRGSVDDVFAPGPKGGKLQQFTSFFTGNGTLKDDPPGVIGSRRGGAGFCCCSRLSPVPNVKESPPNGGGVPIIRIATMRASNKEPTSVKVLFATDPRCVPEEHESCVRWLVFRPSLCGISLSSLSNLIVPSPRTAFLDGAVFQKMDVVRSLAASGLWDIVLFVDNNLSELGVVRPGLGIRDYYRLKGAGDLRSFFLSDFLLLRASSALVERYLRSRTPRPSVCEVRSEGSCYLSSTEVVGCGKVSPRYLTEKTHQRFVFVGGEGGNSKEKRFGYEEADEDYARDDERAVKLIVGHFHMEAERFNGCKKLVPFAFQRDVQYSFHPVFSSGGVCRDDQVAEILQDFREYERELLSDASRLGFFGRPVPGWEPNVALVRCSRCAGHRQRPPLRDLYKPICNDINRIVANVQQLPPGERNHVIKREAGSLYKRLIRCQLVVDPFLIDRVALMLFYIATSNHQMMPSVLDTLRREVHALMNDGTAAARGPTKGKSLSSSMVAQKI